MDAILTWLEGTGIASVLHSSLWLLPAISSIHVFCMVWVIGGILVISLRLLGIVMTDRPVTEVAQQIGRFRRFAIAGSIVSGILLFVPDAAKCFKSSLFDAKMTLLAIALLFHFTIYRRAIQRNDLHPRIQAWTGGLAVLLWFGVATLGSVFTFIEG